MGKRNRVQAVVLALSLMSVASVAQAKFYKHMTAMQVSQEVTVWLLSGMSLDMIANAAQEADLPSAQVAASLIQAGQEPATVVAVLIKADPQAAGAVTVAALTVKPAQAAAITAAAISAAPDQSKMIAATAMTVSGGDPSEAMPATAAGGEESR